MIITYRYHQDSDHARFAHPEQPSFSGQHYNRNPAIPRNSKQYKNRNSYWRWIHQIAVFLACFCDTNSQSGAAVLERLHANAQLKAISWITRIPLGLPRGITMDLILKCLFNKDAAIRNNKLIIAEPSKFSEHDVAEASMILTIFDAILGLDSISAKVKQSKSMHLHLKFDKHYQALEQHLKSSVTHKKKIYIYYVILL